MKKITVLLTVFLFVSGICGQTASDSEPKLYQGEEHFPYIFDSYKIDEIKNPAGFKLSTNITDFPAYWQETFKINLTTIGEFELGMKIISDIDLKTGLLKKQRFETGELWGEAVFDENRVTLTQNKGNKTDSYTYELPEKIYPCYFSAAFPSYLPLNGNFSGSFMCFVPDFGDIRKSFLTKFSIKEIAAEKVATPKGIRDCYVIVGAGVVTREISDNGKNPKKTAKKSNSKFTDIAQKFNSKIWVDKKTHQAYFQ